MTDEIYVENENWLLREYVQTLHDTMEKLGCTTAPPTLEELKCMMSERELFGIIASCVCLPVILVDKGKEFEPKDILGDDQITNPVFSSDIFRRTLSKKLKRFDDLGLFN